ncbi:MAG: hypothetical protein JWN66_4132 [Sphingomonas bacterium]|uniref:hypothetical protein n=1 Tax=Sphingomonas bacterium TaxID=1895847 RepID=UPI002630A2C0|nr:hypothetical protein [Sphingomonas bacterium]MDB5707016.1 hypothetical protein [Sphingomonas bacterium]
MELLLFLSALLTALTGAISGARAPEAQTHQVCGAVGAVQAATAVRVVPARAIRTYLALVPGLESRAVKAVPAFPVATALFAAIPRYLDKPRN